MDVYSYVIFVFPQSVKVRYSFSPVCRLCSVMFKGHRRFIPLKQKQRRPETERGTRFKIMELTSNPHKHSWHGAHLTHWSQEKCFIF